MCLAALLAGFSFAMSADLAVRLLVADLASFEIVPEVAYSFPDKTK